MMQKKPQANIEEIAREHGYPPEAFQFVREGLNFTVEWIHDDLEPGQRRHISGQQLCEGLRQLALKKWGRMARSVLKKWRIESTADFGRIVFVLVQHGWMQKEPTDDISDFDQGYDFEEAFEKSFHLELKD